MKIQIEKPLLKSLTLMASVIEARDAYTGGHLWRVSQYCRGAQVGHSLIVRTQKETRR